MNISYEWLKELVDLDVVSSQVDQLAQTLTMLGLAVEAVHEEDEDWVFELDITTNRPDCLNHLGVARELAAYYGLKLRKPDFSPPAEQEPVDAFPASVEILDPDLCPRYAARVMTDLQIMESPGWLKRRLEAAGQRPINNVVDATNYVLMELGHPLHAFDYAKLPEGRIIVRRARPGEILVTLDGARQDLDEDMLAICDRERPTAVGGVMGGADSEIGPETRTMLLESAYFLPASIRRTSRRIGLRTEASYRFERGADPEMPAKALNRACRLLEEIARGRCVGPVIDVYPGRHQPVKIPFRERRIQQVCGIRVEPSFVNRTLQALEFEVASEEPPWEVTVPSFRVDVSREDDLVEEVLRHYGYDRIQATYPAPEQMGHRHPSDELEQSITQTLVGAGFFEAVNLVFTVPERETVFWQSVPEMVGIVNPLSLEDSHLRVSLIPGLLNSVRRNLSRGISDVRLFELGNVYQKASPYREETRLGLAATGSFYHPSWRAREHQFDFFHLKGVVEAVLEKLGCQARFEKCEGVSWLHSGIAANVLIEGRRLGALGSLHPRISKEMKFRQPLLVAELSLSGVFEGSCPIPRYASIGRFPSVEQDLSFVVDKQVEYATIETAIKALNIPELRGVRLIDFYQGRELPQGKVGLTVRLAFENPERTLTQQEVNLHREAVVDALSGAVGAQIRS